MAESDLQSPVERLRQAFDLFEAGLSMKRDQLRRAHPKAGEGEIEAMLQAWLGTRAGAEHGEATGRVRPLDSTSP